MREWVHGSVERLEVKIKRSGGEVKKEGEGSEL